MRLASRPRCRLMPRTRPGASILHCDRDALHAADQGLLEVTLFGPPATAVAVGVEPICRFEQVTRGVPPGRQLQDKLVGDQPLTPERAEEITKTMDRADIPPGFPPTDAGFTPGVAAGYRRGESVSRVSRL
jgi:hypothetical protein